MKVACLGYSARSLVQQKNDDFEVLVCRVEVRPLSCSESQPRREKALRPGL